MTDTIPFTVSDNAAKRIAFLLSDEPDGTRFRVAVLGGGCSGFQYHFTLDNEAITDEDRIIEKDGAFVIVDTTSIDLIAGSELDYIETLGSAGFELKNPQAASSCGCGNSFSIA
jgi:iron-sulfur cluster insertion protein